MVKGAAAVTGMGAGLRTTGGTTRQASPAPGNGGRFHLRATMLYIGLARRLRFSPEFVALPEIP